MIPPIQRPSVEGAFAFRDSLEGFSSHNSAYWRSHYDWNWPPNWIWFYRHSRHFHVVSPISSLSMASVPESIELSMQLRYCDTYCRLNWAKTCCCLYINNRPIFGKFIHESLYYPLVYLLFVCYVNLHPDLMHSIDAAPKCFCQILFRFWPSGIFRF